MTLTMNLAMIKKRKNHVSSLFSGEKQSHVTYNYICKSVMPGAPIRCCTYTYLWICSLPVPVVMRFLRTLPSKLLVTTAVLVQKYLMTCYVYKPAWVFPFFLPLLSLLFVLQLAKRILQHLWYLREQQSHTVRTSHKSDLVHLLSWSQYLCGIF